MSFCNYFSLESGKPSFGIKVYAVVAQQNILGFNEIKL